MKLTVNGDPMEVPQGETAAALLEGLKLNPGLVVVELNMTILKRNELEETMLKENDELEIVHFVGGGSDGR